MRKVLKLGSKGKIVSLYYDIVFLRPQGDLLLNSENKSSQMIVL